MTHQQKIKIPLHLKSKVFQPKNTDADKTIQQTSNTEVEDLVQDRTTEVEPGNSDNNLPVFDESNTVAHDLDITGPVATSSQVDNSDGQLGGLSAEELPPIELSKRLIVDIERYPNLLKRFQEGKVRTKPTKTEEERLNEIKTKIISKAQFDQYNTNTISKETDDDKPEGSKEPDSPKLASIEEEEESSGSSKENSDGHDDSDTDPLYDPHTDADGEQKPKKPKLEPKPIQGTILCWSVRHNLNKYLIYFIIFYIEYAEDFDYNFFLRTFKGDVVPE